MTARLWVAEIRRSLQQGRLGSFLALLLVVAGMDGLRPFKFDWSMLYFLPACYLGWSTQGRFRNSLFFLMTAVVFLAPLPLDPYFITDESRVFNRVFGVGVGFVLVQVLRRVRELMNRMEAANQTLELRVAERTHELQCANIALQAEIAERKQAQIRQHETQRQLLQSQKMEVVGQFAGGIAHDFNNMLTVILGYTSLLQDRHPEDEGQTNILTTINNAGQRAADLTRQLLVFSRHRVVQSTAVQLNGLIRDTERMLRPLIPESIDLIIDLSPNLPLVDIDPAQFSQVLINLAVNARDSMPTGGTLTIRTLSRPACSHPADFAEESQGERCVLMEFIDTGCGMTPEIRERIFEPFFTTKSAGRGVGLGLSIVDGIVSQSHGRVTVCSTPGQGTRFQVSLPATSKAWKSSSTQAAAPGESRGELILLVEDEDQLRKLAGHVLQKAGYHVVDACNSADARAKAEVLGQRIDLLLTDVVMPGMSGRQLCDWLRPKHQNMRVLYMSGYNDDAILAFGVEHEAVHFLAKPFSPGDLVLKVGQVLQHADTVALASKLNAA